MPRMRRSQEMRSPKYTRYDLPCASCESGYVYKQNNKQWIHIFHWFKLHIVFAKSFQQAICLLCFQNVLSKWYLWYRPWLLSRTTLIVYVCVIYQHKCCEIQFCCVFCTKLLHIIKRAISNSLTLNNAKNGKKPGDEES